MKQFNFLGALANAGIVPSNDEQYSLRSFLDAFIKAFGAAPITVCYRERFIQELRFCVSKEFKLFNCYDGGRPTCGSSVTLPPAH